MTGTNPNVGHAPRALAVNCENSVGDRGACNSAMTGNNLTSDPRPGHGCQRALRLNVRKGDDWEQTSDPRGALTSALLLRNLSIVTAIASVAGTMTGNNP
jgi:hypothetical protein